MTFSINVGNSHNINHRLNDLFLALGKSLYIANEFERKCKWLWKVAVMEKTYACRKSYGENHRKAWDAAIDEIQKKKFLARMVSEMLGYREPENEIRILDRARVARNWIAHKGGSIGPISHISGEDIESNLLLLNAAVDDLVPGDYLVSKWAVEVQEKLPIRYATGWEYWESDLYEKSVKKWILEGGPPIMPEILESPAKYFKK